MCTEQIINRKEKILDACISKNRQSIWQLKDRIKILTSTDNTEDFEELNENTKRVNDLLKISEINTLNATLESLNQQHELLEKLKTFKSVRETVAMGSVVGTNRFIFFISTSIQQFITEEGTCIGVSTQSPIFKSMAGKRKGEQFSFKGMNYTIDEIY